MSDPPCAFPGLWWNCTTSTPNFLGCCSHNPCGGTGCAIENLYPARLPIDGQDVGPTLAGCPAGSLWYSCAKTNPTFQGCCGSGENPCLTGRCKLVAACAGSCRGWSATQVAPASATAVQTSVAPSSVSSSPIVSPGGKPPAAILIAGITGGIAVLLVMVGFGSAFLILRKMKARAGMEAEERAIPSENASPYAKSFEVGASGRPIRAFPNIKGEFTTCLI
jgi:hypothetical protein